MNSQVFMGEKKQNKKRTTTTKETLLRNKTWNLRHLHFPIPHQLLEETLKTFNSPLTFSSHTSAWAWDFEASQMSFTPSLHPKGWGSSTCFLRSKSGVEGPLTGTRRLRSPYAGGLRDAPLLLQLHKSLPERSCTRSSHHALEPPTWVRATSDAAQNTQWLILDPHFSQRRNPQASEVGKSPVSCCDVSGVIERTALSQLRTTNLLLPRCKERAVTPV